MSSKTLHRQYYFAFGSNMSLTQMAERCPGSTFIGKATLQGYRWQINQRHVANIVKATDEYAGVTAGEPDAVEGLLFSISDKDRRTLDRKEGIKLGLYERVVLNVLLERNPIFSDNKTAFVRDRLQDAANAVDPPASYEGKLMESRQKDPPMPGAEIEENAADLQHKHSVWSPNPTPSEKGPATDSTEVEAITYLSTKYAKDGLIRHEYVQRMENAIRDAVKLNVSRDFIERCLEPYIHGEVYQPEEHAQGNPSNSDPSVSQTVLEKSDKKTNPGPVFLSAAGQQAPDQAHQAHPTKKIPDPKSMKQPLRREYEGDEDSENRRSRQRVSEGGKATRQEQEQGSTGFWWSAVSSIFGSDQSQGSAPKDR